MTFSEIALSFIKGAPMSGRKNINEMENRGCLPVPLLWIRIMAFACGLVSLMCLIALMSQGVWAEDGDEKSGFEPGTKPFNNPFADAQPTDPSAAPAPTAAPAVKPLPNRTFPKVTRRTPSPSTTKPGAISVSPKGAPADDNVPNPMMSPEGLVVGGGQPGGVIPASKNSSFPVDTESGSGSSTTITDFNYPNVDIMVLAKTMGKLTGKNFIFDKDVKGDISIISNSPITVGDAWRAFLTALDAKGFTLIPSGKYIRIARHRDARDKQIKTYTGDFTPNTDAMITKIFTLKHISAEDVARNFRSFLSANSRLMPYEQTNSVIVTDTGANIAKMAQMLEFLDVAGFDASIEVIPVVHASAVELAKLIDTLLPGTASQKSTTGRRTFGGGTGNFTARRTNEGGVINNIIADERTNNLIIHANAKGAEQVKELVKKLDKLLPPTAMSGGKLHVIYLQFADAEEVAKILNNLYTQSSQKGAKPTTAGGIGTNPTQENIFEGSLKFSADKATNSIVITASAGDFDTVKRVIEKLDIARDEVYVEAVIMEMSIGNNFNWSSNFAAPAVGLATTPNEDLINFITSPMASQGAVLGFSAGKGVEIGQGDKKTTVSSYLGLIKALQGDSNISILATPQLMTLDNIEATFESNENIPTPTQTTANNTTTNSYTKEKVGLSLTIKPQINKISNFVKMDIKAKIEELSDNIPAELKGKTFASTERRAQTTLVVADGDTVVLGGLVRDTQNESNAKIPILGDIPVLGWLFKAHNTKVAKTNLFMFITPKIIRHYEKVRAILDKKLKERDDFVDKHADGNDLLKEHREKLTSDLPDLKKLLESTPSSITLDEPTPKTGNDENKGDNKDATKPDEAKPAEPPAEPTADIPPVNDTDQIPPELLEEPVADDVEVIQ